MSDTIPDLVAGGGTAVDGTSELIARTIDSARLGLLGPEIILLVTGLVVLMLGALLSRERQRAAGNIALFGVLLSLMYLVLVLGPGSWVLERAGFGGLLDRLGSSRVPGSVESGFAGLFLHDPFAVFFKYLFLVATFLVMLLSLRYLDEESANVGEYFALLCFATLGMMFMASGNSLVTIYVGLELMALSVYVLVGFLKTSRRSNEAAMKYFILGAMSSAFFIYGISLLYGITGQTSLDSIRVALDEGNPLNALALIMISVGLGFKVAAVPFHAWAPDVYEGAPTPITAYISVASKAAAFAILMRILLVGLYDMRGQWTLLLWILAAATMTFGNLAAIVQDNVKRMLAYSSIAHAGYVLLGVLAAGASPPASIPAGSDFRRMEWMNDLQQWAQGGVLIYLFVYTFMNIGAFAVLTMLRRRKIAGDQLSDFAGLFQRSPVAAIAMAVFLLSLAGIPPTAGFIGKLVLFGAAMKAGFYALAVIAVLNTAVSVYFYFRIVVMMWMKEPAEQAPYAFSPELAAGIAVALLFTLGVGVYPAPFVDLAQRSILEVAGAYSALSGL